MTVDAWLAEALKTFGNIENLEVDVNAYPEKYTEKQKAVVDAAGQAEIARIRKDTGECA